ncbi:MAG: helix-turn-helix domain-containing protein [Hydrogenophaga sp.]
MSEGWQTLDAGDQPAPAQGQGQVFNQPSGLRQAREATGLHIAALAAALKVPVKKLEALEDGRYGDLPDLTFARALASSACRHLKIDSAPILERFPQANAPSLGVPQASMNTTFQPDQGLASFGFSEQLKKPAVLITGLVLIGALGVGFLPDWSQWPGKTWLDEGSRWVQNIARSEPQGDAGAPETVALSAAGAETASAAPMSETALAGDAGVPLKLDRDANSAPLAQRASTSTVLRLEAVSDAWVEVVDGEGKVQIQRNLNKGDVLDFSSTPPYSVVLGRADAVAVTVRGQAFDVGPYARNSVARFQVR